MSEEKESVEFVKGGPTSTNLFWIDLEMTSLDCWTGKILEIFVLVTNSNLDPIDMFEAVIHYDENELSKISRWTLKTHQVLLNLVRQSSRTLKSVEEELGKFFDRYRYGKQAVLAGSAVYFDLKWLEYHMPSLISRLHYRVLDVSTFMEIAKRWFPSLHQFAPPKSTSHRAREDVYSSLNLLTFYRQYMFQPPIYPKFYHR